jgi:hypothetical protein
MTPRGDVAARDVLAAALCDSAALRPAIAAPDQLLPEFTLSGGNERGHGR